MQKKDNFLNLKQSLAKKNLLDHFSLISFPLDHRDPPETVIFSEISPQPKLKNLSLSLSLGELDVSVLVLGQNDAWTSLSMKQNKKCPQKTNAENCQN